MGILDLFKSGPESGREPELKDREMIIAYLEDLGRTKSAITVQLSAQDLVPHQGTVQLVNDARNRFALGLKRPLAQELEPKAPLTLIFTLDGFRLQATVHYLGRGGYLQIEASLPERILFAERRGKLRARFGPREHASVTALQDLFQGTGTAGKLLNLSMEGLCMQIERAILVPGDRKLEITDGLFTRGQKLLMVRIQELPHVPMIECSGEVAWIRAAESHVEMGLKLWGVGAQENQYLEQVMTRRLPSFSRAFPVRHRRHSEGAEPGGGGARGAGPGPLASGAAPEAEAPGAEGGAGSPGPAEEAAQVPTTASLPEELKGRDRLLHFRRNSKHILVVMGDDLDRAILTGTLQVGGFTNLHEAKGLVQAIERCKKHIPDLLILDAQIGPHTAPDVVTKLRGVGVLEMSPVVVLVDKADVKVKLAAKAMKLKHLLDKPVDYDGLMKGLLDKLLDLR